MHRVPGGRGDQSDPLGYGRDRFLVRWIEESLPVQLFLQLLKGQSQLSDPIRLDRIAAQLVLSAGDIDRRLTGGNHLHPVPQLKPQKLGPALKHHTPQRALLILQRKIVVPFVGDRIVGHLALHRQLGHPPVPCQHAVHICPHLTGGQDCIRLSAHRAPSFCTALQVRMAAPMALSVE